MNIFMFRGATPIALAILLAACGGERPDPGNTSEGEPTEATADHAGEASAPDEAATVLLSAQQIRLAGIEIVRPTVGGGGMLTLPATIDGDPQATQVVSAAIGGRVVALNRNLGEPVARGQVLAVIESREAASLKAEVEASRARLALAQSNLAREERLFGLRVSPERDVIAARTAATEARIAHRLAQQQVAAAGAGGGALNRVGITAPIAGRVTARPVTLGQTVAADAELYRVSNLARVSVTMALSPDDAARVRTGTAVEIGSGGRRTTARISYVSPVLDETTRLVTAIALIDNRAGLWRIGEAVSAVIRPDGERAQGITVPSGAVHTVENRAVVFVRTREGFRAVPVTIGSRGSGAVTITAGLEGSEEIAAANSFILKAELGKGEAGHGH